MLNRLLIISGLLSFHLLSGCVQHTSLSPEQRPVHWAQQIDQTKNLYEVSEWIYRSEQPLSNQQNELRQLGITTIINLRSRNQSEKEFKHQNIQVVHLPIHTWAISRNDVLETMRQLKRAHQQQQKVLIHCYHGSDRTGTMVAMYRIVFENWSIEEAVKEMKYGGYGFHPVWININKLFTKANIEWIRQHVNESIP